MLCSFYIMYRLVSYYPFLSVCVILQAEFELDRKQRMEREERMVKQLTDHEHHTSETFEKQIVSVLSCICAIFFVSYYVYVSFMFCFIISY